LGTQGRLERGEQERNGDNVQPTVKKEQRNVRLRFADAASGLGKKVRKGKKNVRGREKMSPCAASSIFCFEEDQEGTW